MSDGDLPRQQVACPGPVRASVVSLTCMVRDLPLFLRAAPGTPLRVLCIIALDTLHLLRRSQPLSRTRIGEVATFLDFQACTNAVWDRKSLCRAEYQALRTQLDDAGLGTYAEAYLDRLGALESRRPPIGGGQQRFDEARSYREAVARLALATITAVAFRGGRPDGDVCASDCDGDVETLLPIVMQCQIIDDVLDYAEDVSAGLPSFLTASSSLADALALTAAAARDYAASRALRSAGALFPLRVALLAVTAVTTVVVRLGARRYRHAPDIARSRASRRHAAGRASPAGDYDRSTTSPASDRGASDIAWPGPRTAATHREFDGHTNLREARR